MLKEEKFTCNRAELAIRGMYFYEENGENEKLPAVIISHGFTGNYADVISFCKRFVKLGFAAFCYSFCGGGRPGEKEETRSEGEYLDMTIGTEVADLIAVKDYVKTLDFVDAGKITLCGFSQGGFVSGLAAAKLGREIERLIMVYPAICIPDHARAGILGGAHYDPKNVPEIIDCGVRKLGKAFHDEVVAMEPFAELSKYDGPVLILQGMRDMVVNYSYAIRAKESYKPNQCHLQLIRCLGHGQGESEEKYMFDSMKEFILGRKEILSIRVIITHNEMTNEGDKKIHKLYFNGFCENENFIGTVLPGACDTQCAEPGQPVQFNAVYTLEGLDRRSRKCHISVVNRNVGDEWKPTVQTDSEALSFLNRADLSAVLEWGDGGPTVRIFAPGDAR